MNVCEHTTQELRKRSTANGGYQYAYQCLDCAQRVGTWTKKPSFEVPEWDWEGEGAVKSMNVTAAKAAYDARRESEHQLWWRTYQRFTSSPAWRTMRHRVLTRSGNMCEACLVQRAAQVHHTAYPAVVLVEGMRAEEYGQALFQALTVQPLYELRAICMECHAHQHPHMREAA